MNTYPIPSATLIATGDKSGHEYGRNDIYESPVTEEVLDVERMDLREEVVASLGFNANRGQLGDTSVDISVAS